MPGFAEWLAPAAAATIAIGVVILEPIFGYRIPLAIRAALDDIVFAIPILIGMLVLAGPMHPGVVGIFTNALCRKD